MIGQRKLLERLDQMLEDGINGTFEESTYDESEMSRLEAKWYRYLTSSKLAYQKTKKEQERIQEMVSDISHQTKTPLSNILLYTELLREQNLDETSQGLVEEIRQQSEKLEFLIQSLVKTSRLEAGTIQLAQVHQDLCPMVEAALSQIRPKAQEKQIRLRHEKQECFAKYDPKWTQEAVFNLLDNAVKYSPEGSEIRVTYKEFELFSAIEITDQGIGISEEEQPLIFGRFYRGRDVREQSGVGIGLYLTRQIIEGQGGYVNVRSEKGKGSTFEVFLPR
ncbi:MAG: HAMP domain-containing histidine kinase [Lachnospiraceae bacterium]|nr:HAMP domain-containing histidine kinase [Lachnospiraceae bacterium]